VKPQERHESLSEATTAVWYRRLSWDWKMLALVIPVALTVCLVFPDKGVRVAEVSKNFFLEMLYILPAVMILMGLFAVWVERDVVVKYMGAGAGVRGLLLSMLLGALPTGPLYVAFPMGAMLIRKGARVANVMAFLSAWACIKIPQEMVELQFMGWQFTATRLLLTVILVGVMCLFAEWVYNRLPQRETGD
jgi:uncharacterized membrane protein YraQ (UPF0718 family)